MHAGVANVTVTAAVLDVQLTVVKAVVSSTAVSAL